MFFEITSHLAANRTIILNSNSRIFALYIVNLYQEIRNWAPTYPEYSIRKVVASYAKVARSIPAEAALIYILCTSLSGVTAHEGGGATRRLDLPSLAPLLVAGCGRLQLGVPIVLLQ